MNRVNVTTPNKILIKFIIAYQEYISPHKGFCCAHSALHGNSSCSSWAIRILKKQKLLLFLPLMQRRFKSCQLAYEKLKSNKEKESQDESEASECPCATKKTTANCLSVFPLPCSFF